MFIKAFAIAIGVNVPTLTPGSSFLTAGGGLHNSMEVTKEAVFTLARGTPEERRCFLKAMVVDTTAYCSLLGMDFVAGEGEVIDTWAEIVSHRYEDTAGVTQVATLPHHATPLHLL